MRQSFLAVQGSACYQYIIEKSRFIACAHYIDSEQTAHQIIQKVGQEYRDATHNCYGYITGEGGNIVRFWDDGEPSKTAGLPILEVIRGRGLRNTLVVVTRYFGGIKLGAGGLVRAYVNSAVGALDSAGTAKYDYCKFFTIQLGYSEHDTAQRLAENCGAKVISKDFADGVTLHCAVPAQAFEECQVVFSDFLKDAQPLKCAGEGYMTGF